MIRSDGQEKAKANVEDILAEFDGIEGILAEFCAKTKSLIEACLQDGNITYQSVQFRVKTRKKLREKYLDPAKDYRKLGDITDLAGLRVITYYEDDVDRVAEVIKREFDIDWENSADKRNPEPDKFGYNALNYVCGHLGKRLSDVEYKKFTGTRGEIQITSILRHAWSEIEHEWYDLKDAYPDGVKRRFYRIAALLELAESEFLDIKKGRKQYERSIDVRVGANDLDVLIDAVSMRSFIEQEPLVAEIDTSISIALGRGAPSELSDKSVDERSRAARLAGLTKLQEIRDLLVKYKTAIPKYSARCRKEVWPHIPPAPQLSKGISVYVLSQVLANLGGTDATAEFFKSYGFGFTPNWDIARQVAIAKEIVQESVR